MPEFVYGAGNVLPKVGDRRLGSNGITYQFVVIAGGRYAWQPIDPQQVYQEAVKEWEALVESAGGTANTADTAPATTSPTSPETTGSV